MGDSEKSGMKALEISADGRTAANWSAFKRQLDGLLAAKEHKGIYLNDLLFKRIESWNLRTLATASRLGATQRRLGRSALLLIPRSLVSCGPIGTVPTRSPTASS